jgi:hypothetical protein
MAQGGSTSILQRRYLNGKAITLGALILGFFDQIFHILAQFFK